jgi:hypothetical protein
MLAQDLAIYTALMDRHGSFGQTLRVPRGDRRADYATACGLIAAYPDTFEAGHLTVVRDWIAEARRLAPIACPSRGLRTTDLLGRSAGAPRVVAQQLAEAAARRGSLRAVR